MDQITVSTAAKQEMTVKRFINEHLRKLGCSERTRIYVDVAVDETFSNIANNAYYPGTGAVTVEVRRETNPLAAVITFIDNGTPGNPLKKKKKAGQAAGETGLYIVKKVMDDVSYAYREGRNILTMRKKL